MLKYLTIPAALVLAAICSCRPEAPAVEQVPDPAASPPPAASGGLFSKPPSATSPAVPQGAVMATVNGQPVYMKQLHDVLIRGQGLEMAQQLVASEIIQQEAQRRKLSATDDEAQAEHQQMLADVFPSLPEPEQRERALAQLLVERGWSRVRWELLSRRNALLRKMAEPNAVVTDEMLRAEYADQYGRKAIVRHIEVESLNEAEKMMKALKMKADFADLAKRFSKNPSAGQGGLLPPMTKTAPAEIPEVIREVAFSLKQPGDVSEPVKVGYAFHLLRLERFVEPTTAPLEQVRDKLRAALKEKLIRQWQQQLMYDLMRAAKYEFVDPVLRDMNTKATATP